MVFGFNIFHGLAVVFLVLALWASGKFRMSVAEASVLAVVVGGTLWIGFMVFAMILPEGTALLLALLAAGVVGLRSRAMVREAVPGGGR